MNTLEQENAILITSARGLLADGVADNSLQALSRAMSRGRGRDVINQLLPEMGGVAAHPVHRIAAFNQNQKQELGLALASMFMGEAGMYFRDLANDPSINMDVYISRLQQHVTGTVLPSAERVYGDLKAVQQSAKFGLAGPQSGLIRSVTEGDGSIKRLYTDSVLFDTVTKISTPALKSWPF